MTFHVIWDNLISLGWIDKIGGRYIQGQGRVSSYFIMAQASSPNVQICCSTRIKTLTLIQAGRNALPQPKLKARSLPVPRGMTATEGGGCRRRSLIVPRIQATVPSPPAANIFMFLKQAMSIGIQRLWTCCCSCVLIATSVSFLLLPTCVLSVRTLHKTITHQTCRNPNTESTFRIATCGTVSTVLSLHCS